MDYVPCSGLCSQTGAAPLAVAAAPPVQQPPPSPAAPPSQQQHLAFLQGWKSSIAPKLQQLLTLLAGQEVACNLAVAQIWTYLPVLTEGRQLLKAEQLCLLGDASLQGFHIGCAQEGVTVSQLGPMGKVWESGAVQVVQCADSLSCDAHPRNRLPGELSGRIAECVYLPVYDRTGQVSQGVLAVVELLVRSQAADYMVVANAISCVTHLMEALQLSLSNPHQQQHASAPATNSAAPHTAAVAKNGQPPAKRLALGGNGACSPAGAAAMAATPTSAALQMPHSNSFNRNNAGWGGTAASNGASKGMGMGRTISMATFC